jgi:hypothetical protein
MSIYVSISDKNIVDGVFTPGRQKQNSSRKLIATAAIQQ